MRVSERWDKVIAATIWFRGRMLRKFEKHDSKGYWMDVPEETAWDYFYRLIDEVKELEDELYSGSVEAAIDECADVANFAMMIAQKVKANGKVHNGTDSVGIVPNQR